MGLGFPSLFCFMNRNMRRLVLLFALCALGTSVFTETISWKGMEFGGEQNPAWLRNLVQKNDERATRKKFEIDKTFRIFFGVGKDVSLESAKSDASADCMKKILAAEKTDVAILSGLTPVYDFWTRDEDGYTVYAVYKLKKH